MLDPTLAEVFNKIADITALSVFFGMVAFIILYSSFYQWRKRRAGKSVLLLAVAYVLIAFISILAPWVGGDFWFRPLWRMLAWFYGAFAVGYLIYALLYNWRDRNPIEIDVRTGSTLIDSGREGK